MTSSDRDAERALAEPLAQAPILRGDRDWAARTRATAVEAQRYSRFVSIMKRALPLAAVALLASVLIYSLQPRQQSKSRVAMTFQRLGIVNNDLAMIKPRLNGNDNSGNPYVVTADQAIQNRASAKTARMKNVEGDEILKGGDWVDVRGTTGQLNAKQRTLALAGVVSMYAANGYELHTTAADVDMASGVIVGNVPATGQGPLGTFSADRFKADHRAKQVFLYGNVHMIIDGHGTKGK
jgi:lipopolysaccharide export system protein LptC